MTPDQPTPNPSADHPKTPQVTRLPLADARERLLQGLPAPDPLANVQPGQAGAHGGGALRLKQRQEVYLKSYANCRNVRASALAAGITREQVYRWRKQKAFVELEQKAEQDYLDVLRAQLDDRAKTSDAVLMMKARSLLPEFKETVRTEHALGDTNGMPIRFSLNIGESTEPTADTAEPPLTGTNGHEPA